MGRYHKGKLCSPTNTTGSTGGWRSTCTSSRPATDRNAYANDKFPPEDPGRMASVLRQVPKPCLAFKILAASRNCASAGSIREALRYALDNIKPTDAIVVGMLQKHKNQVRENAELVRDILNA